AAGQGGGFGVPPHHRRRQPGHRGRHLPVLGRARPAARVGGDGTELAGAGGGGVGARAAAGGRGGGRGRGAGARGGGGSAPPPAPSWSPPSGWRSASTGRRWCSTH